MRRAQEMPTNFGNFPPGWKFAFDVTRPDLPHLKGLVLFPPSPNTRKYASVEKAVNHNKTALANVEQQSFYAYVGLPTNVPEGKATESNNGYIGGLTKRPSSSNGVPVSKKARVVVADVPIGLSLRELYEQRCKRCVMCVRPACGKCESCKANTSHTRTFKDVCMQKVSFFL